MYKREVRKFHELRYCIYNAKEIIAEQKLQQFSEQEWTVGNSASKGRVPILNCIKNDSVCKDKGIYDR